MGGKTYPEILSVSQCVREDFLEMLLAAKNTGLGPFAEEIGALRQVKNELIAQKAWLDMHVATMETSSATFQVCAEGSERGDQVASMNPLSGKGYISVNSKTAHRL